jgi:hypothetical protein
MDLSVAISYMTVCKFNEVTLETFRDVKKSFFTFQKIMNVKK